MFSTTPCMMPTNASLNPKSVVKVTMRGSAIDWKLAANNNHRQAGCPRFLKQNAVPGRPRYLPTDDLSGCRYRLTRWKHPPQVRLRAPNLSVRGGSNYLAQ